MGSQSDASNASRGSDAFDEFAALLDYPMFVVTTVSGARRAGCLVGFATQVSIRPQRFMVGLSDKNHTFEVAATADRLAVHLLPAHERDLAQLFAQTSGDEVDKFAQCAWEPDSGGVPVLTGAVAWFSGPILARVPLGDHVGHVIEPDCGECRERSADVITFAAVRDLHPGHEA